MKMLNMNKLKNTLKPVVPFVKKVAPTVLKIAGIGFVGFGVYDAIQQGPIAREAIEKAEEEKGEELNIKEKVVTTAPVLWRPVASTIVGLGCLCGGYHIDLKKAVKENLELAATASNAKKAYELVKEQYNDYMSGTQDVLAGEPEKLRQIQDRADSRVIGRVTNRTGDPDSHVIGDGEIRCIEPVSRQIFYANKTMLREAMNVINEERLNGMDIYVPYDLFLEQFHLEKTDATELWVFPNQVGNIEATIMYAEMVHGIPTAVVEFSQAPEIDWKLCEKKSQQQWR